MIIKLPDVLEINEVLALLETPNLAKINGYRDRTMLELLYAQACVFLSSSKLS